jgi:hypothetical protein
MDNDDAQKASKEQLPEERRRDVSAIELGALALLLGLVTVVYLVTGSANFSLVIAAVTGLYGAWRTRR